MVLSELSEEEEEEKNNYQSIIPVDQREKEKEMSIYPFHSDHHRIDCHRHLDDRYLISRLDERMKVVKFYPVRIPKNRITIE